MPGSTRSWNGFVVAFVAVLLAPSAAGAQQPAEPQPPRTAEEHHAARRAWLEQQRLGDSAAAVPTYGGARGPQPRQPAPELPADPRSSRADAAWALPRATPLPGWRGEAPVSAWCVAQLRSAGGAPGYGAPGYGIPGQGAHGFGSGVIALEALCVPQTYHPYGRMPFGTWPPGWAPSRRVPHDPAYPPVNRFHHRFYPPADRPHGWQAPPYGSGIHVLPPDPWRLPPWYWGLEPAACAEVRAAGLTGSALLHVGLPVLGATTADELELAIDARLSQNQPVQLQGLDGRWLRIGARTELEHLTVRPCRHD